MCACADGGAELLSLMHFLVPDKCEWHRFVRRDGPLISSTNNTVLLTNEFDLTDANREEKIDELHKQLENLMLRRLKKDVLTSLPTKSERILRVEMSALQTHFYKNILTKVRRFSSMSYFWRAIIDCYGHCYQNFQGLVKSANGNNNISLLNIAMELKKAANHPYLFDGAETRTDNAEETLKGLVMSSGKLVLLDKLLARLRSDGHRVLIFSQMVRMLDILSDYLSLRGYQHQRLDGMVSSDQRKKSIAHFNSPGSTDFVFLLSTRAGGLGINLETADTVIIFDVSVPSVCLSIIPLSIHLYLPFPLSLPLGGACAFVPAHCFLFTCFMSNTLCSSYFFPFVSSLAPLSRRPPPLHRATGTRRTTCRRWHVRTGSGKSRTSACTAS